MDLSAAKQALLEKWLKGQSAVPVNGIPRRPEGGRIPLSFPQQRQLFLELLEPATAVNNLSVLFEFNGKLDKPALQQSANRIIERHEALRTQFTFGKGLPDPVIIDSITLNIPEVDLTGHDPSTQVIEARRLAENEVLLPFDLRQPPLIRLRLFVLNEHRHLFLVVVHHSIADGWSLGVFLQELVQYYQHITVGGPVQLPALSIQYPDYACWQSSAERMESMKPSLDYWKKQLEGELPVLELPIDNARGSRQTFSGSTYRFTLPAPLTTALEQTGKEENATLFMTLLSAFTLLLHRYSGQEEILVGTPVANRTHSELEPLIGVFINTLALRNRVQGNNSFRALLRQTRDISLDAYAHQDLPFEILVRELKPQRDLSRTPLFQVLFNLLNAPMPDINLPGLAIHPMDIDHGVSQFDLTLLVSKTGGQCYAAVEYNSDLFRPQTIARMFRSFLLILEQAVADPDRPLSELTVITGEWRQQVNALNQTAMDFPRDKCLHHLFEEQATRTPDAIAVVYGNTSLTYGELNRQANVLAGHLALLTDGPGMRAGILMERSPEMITALLGVLKAGGTYVPVHTSFPAERISFILEDAGVNVLLTNIDKKIDGAGGVRVVQVNELLAKENTVVPASGFETKPGDLAYIMYTSGSTGRPKGVMVQHRALVNFLWSMRSCPGIEPTDVLLAVTAISFDIAALELYLPLITGATVIVAGREEVENPFKLAEAMVRHKASMMQATPAAWQMLIDSGWEPKQPLKALCGGEALSRKLADRLLTSVSELWNMYGPTETTIWSSLCRVQPGSGPIVIGSPVGNTSLYVLDRYHQPAPAGVTGELYIGGEGLALGYLHQSVLTAEKFIPDFFSIFPGARLYQTGDLARYTEDGSIEVLGRTDNQVKINGNRIETGEIMAVLNRHPAILDALVVVQLTAKGEKRLVAYYVGRSEPGPAAEELHGFLAQSLPAYMIPAFFIRVDAFPLTPNGKTDRKALPLPEDLFRQTGYVAPQSREEEILAAIWQEALMLERVGVHDNFFDLGGASIQSLQMVAKANMLGLRVNVEHIFEYQTIAGLAEMLKREQMDKG